MMQQRNLYRAYPMVPAVVQNEDFSLPKLLRGLLSVAVSVASFVLAAMFLWLGMLKFTGASPALELLNSSAPMLAGSPFLGMIAWAEIVIALGLVFERFRKAASILLMTGFFFYIGLALREPATIFAANSWVLTTHGEFLANNLAILSAGLFIVGCRGRR